jgi:hypothetical protein
MSVVPRLRRQLNRAFYALAPIRRLPFVELLRLSTHTLRYSLMNDKAIIPSIASSQNMSPSGLPD